MIETLNDDLIVALTAQQSEINVEDTMAEAGRKALLTQLIAMLKHEPGSRSGDDPEDVHDMRVAIRRMRSALQLLEPYFKSKPIRYYRKQLRKVMKSLGGVRDLDVLLEDLRGYAKKHDPDNQLAPVFAHLNDARELARHELISTLDRSSYRRFVEDYAQFLTQPGKGARTDDNGDVHPVQVRHVLPPLLYEHLGAVRAYDAVLSDADANTLHALRIEFKRLRYAVSLFSEILGKGAGEFVDEIKIVQDHLGRLNDIQNATDSLRGLTKLFDAEANAGAIDLLERYAVSLAAEGETLRNNTDEIWRRFNTKTVQRQLANAVAGL